MACFDDIRIFAAEDVLLHASIERTFSRVLGAECSSRVTSLRSLHGRAHGYAQTTRFVEDGVELFALTPRGFNDNPTMLAHLVPVEEDTAGDERRARLVGVTPIAHLLGDISLDDAVTPCDILVPVQGDRERLHETLLDLVETRINPVIETPFLTRVPGDEIVFDEPRFDVDRIVGLLDAVVLLYASAHPPAKRRISHIAYLSAFENEETGQWEKASVSCYGITDEGEAIAQRICKAARGRGFRWDPLGRSTAFGARAYRDNWVRKPWRSTHYRRLAEPTALERARAVDLVATFLAEYPLD